MVGGWLVGWLVGSMTRDDTRYVGWMAVLSKRSAVSSFQTVVFSKKLDVRSREKSNLKISFLF